MITQYLNVNGGIIAYEILPAQDDVTKGTIVCVPGMGDLRTEYRLVAPRLAAQGYRVVLMDVRGHGESGTAWDDYSVAGVGADILALVRALDCGPALIAGTSMAAGAAVWAAAEQPDTVAGIVLIDPFVSGEAGFLERLLYNVLFQRPWGTMLWKAYYAGLYPCRKPVDFQEYSRDLRNNLNEEGRLEALQAMMLASKAASQARLDRVSAPALVIMGERDPDFKDPHAHAVQVAGSLGGKVSMIPDSGHYPQAEQPEAFLAALFPFLDEVFRAA